MDPTASVVLAEAAATRLGAGIVREMAPIAGLQPTIDVSHSKWLHLRVRAPLQALLNGSKPNMVLRAAWNSPQDTAGPNLRRLQDGRWTLAFSDESHAAAAKQLLDEETLKLHSVCREILSTFLYETELTIKRVGNS
mmetsp:Transcript_31607/g.43850  ORF Transcript_31607/g.43850 Transcript_31607/m.43850 type:complete len:137 (-) Transcript_31607:93-503(-)